MRTFLIFLTSFLVLFSSSAGAQQTPDELGQLWVQAIKDRSIIKLEALIHPGCPKGLDSTEIMRRMLVGELPPQYVIEKSPLGSKEALQKAYVVVPEFQLNLKYLTKTPEDRKKYGIGKGFPIARHKGKWYFAICTKTK